jgi:CheY-like chemotaxis protein
VDWTVRRRESRVRIRRAIVACVDSHRRYRAARRLHRRAALALQASRARYLDDLATLERALHGEPGGAPPAALLHVVGRLVGAAPRGLRRMLSVFRAGQPATDAAADVRARAAAGRTALAPRPLAGLQVLLVDGTPMSRLVGSELLRRAGAVVTLAADGNEAARRVVEDGARFDAMVVDVDTPEMGGLAAARAVRSAARMPRMPIVGMSRQASAGARAGRPDLGIDAWVGKPLNVEHLVSTLRRCPGRRTASALG